MMVRFNEHEGWQASAGDLLRENSGVLYLVGDVNEQGGTCDCCKELFYKQELEYLGNILENPELLHVLIADWAEPETVDGR